MTKRASRTRQQVGALKALLLAGSVIATLAGTRLLAMQEPGGTEASIPATEPVTIVVPATGSSSILPPSTGQGTQVVLKPIPQVVQPHINPVVRTRSSR